MENHGRRLSLALVVNSDFSVHARTCNYTVDMVAIVVGYRSYDVPLGQRRVNDDRARHGSPGCPGHDGVAKLNEATCGWVQEPPAGVERVAGIARREENGRLVPVPSGALG